MSEPISNKKRVTIKDVAVVTGFTAQTVSLALRNKDSIPESTRKIINEAANKLGYIKNDMAINLRNGHSNLIAIVYDNIANPYFSIMTKFIHNYLIKYGYVPLIFAANSYLLEPETLYTVLSCNIAGVISFLDVDRKIAKISESCGLPIVVLGRKSNTDVNWIATAENRGGALAAKFLMDNGCKNNLHITYSLDMICAKERYDGFLKGIKDANLKDDLLIVIGKEALSRRLGEYFAEHEVDGIFAFNDMLAYETLYFLKSINREDIKVVGFDNIQEDFSFPVRINTIGSDKREMAKNCVDILLKKINKHGDLPEHRIFDVFIQMGD